MKAVLFDLDGVLVDTAKYHYQAWKTIAAALDFELTSEQNEHLKGVSRVDSLHKIVRWAGKDIDPQQFEQYLHEKNENYLELIEEVRPKDALPGVLSFLEALQKNQIPIGLGSASKNARPILDRLGITSFFDAIIDGNDVTNSKPNPEVFLKGAKALSVEPTNCLVFEDSQAGIDAARAANMAAIAVGSSEVLKGAIHYISDFNRHPYKELAAFIE